jgi:hypothetical protein
MIFTYARMELRISYAQMFPNIRLLSLHDNLPTSFNVIGLLLCQLKSLINLFATTN